ncbi:FMN phosphatase YigB (HAD superfamily) [Streptosporangium album]|uniref:FMN phosphatase YigB (HAD superfamily) n=1 Tax=Streptosporangium album TaxID=47479 RepID=A0A7W7S340_9ACTN|nr:HAD-IA family hydrolase [Streptosporangium album]MBB4942996.1 FMN phosphatase YigB (HAD superfamily) [Streptosporangium album]
MFPHDAVLCDLDGVLRRFDHPAQADIEARYGLPLMETAFDPALIGPATLGMAKPDRRIYELAAERAGVAPERCLFVDDRLENVEAARALAMTGVHYRSVEDLAAVLG